jgi:amino acid transporter
VLLQDFVMQNTSMIPVAGSAYTYSYAMGEFVAWIIGWDLVLEYAWGSHRSGQLVSICR